jgi:hypothetical protein
MPFVSKAQQKFLHANPDKIGGKEKLKEWDDATDFSTLPARKKPGPKPKSKPTKRLRHTTLAR